MGVLHVGDPKDSTALPSYTVIGDPLGRVQLVCGPCHVDNHQPSGDNHRGGDNQPVMDYLLKGQRRGRLIIAYYPNLRATAYDSLSFPIT